MGNELPVPLEIRVSDSLRLDDDDLVRLRKSSEDHFVERKSFGDWKKDAVKTVVAFANSLPIGQPGFMFIGVKDTGEVEDKNDNLDGIQRTLSEMLKLIYPRIPYTAKALSEGGRQYLAVVVHGSEQRPHFSGPAFIREGSQSIQASEEQYRLLIAERQSKVRELLKWKGKTITREIITGRGSFTPMKGYTCPTLVDCNQFYLTIANEGSQESIPLSRVEISFDRKQNQLKIEVED